MLVATYRCSLPKDQLDEHPIGVDVQVTITEAGAIKWYEPRVMKKYTLLNKAEQRKLIETSYEVITPEKLMKDSKIDEKTSRCNILYDVSQHKFQECPSLYEYCVDYRYVKFWLNDNAQNQTKKYLVRIQFIRDQYEKGMMEYRDFKN